jgi:hypothetical protein
MASLENQSEYNIAFTAFYTQHSNIPLFHHSMWLPNIDDYNKHYISKKL